MQGKERMILREGNNFFEITPLETVPGHLPTPGDTRFAVRIQSEGFAGEGTTWIDFPTLLKFAGELVGLDSKRSGRAEMHSMSPGQFQLLIEAVDGWGHTAISGRLAHAKHAIEFGFDFCPDLLPELVSEFRALTRSTT